MSSTPVISIMMPCYNAANTLPLALASLVWQDYKSWECILVDDGSSDDPLGVIQHFADERIKYFRFEQNRGRGVARQYALEHSTGQYLAILDADDWWYPDKLSRQIAEFELDRSVVLVASALGIVSADGELCGVRGASAGVVTRGGPLGKLGMPPVAWSTCMMDMSAARKARFDSRFRLAQDVDFLLQIMLDRRYVVIPEVTYIYTEYSTVSLGKILTALGFTRVMFAKHSARFPVSSRINIAKAACKSIVYRAAFNLGLRDVVLRRRSRPPTETENLIHKEYRERLVREVRGLMRDRRGATQGPK